MPIYQDVTVTDIYTSVLTTTMRNYRGILTDNIFRSQPLLFMLREKGRKRTIDGGYEIIEHILYGENTTVMFYDGYDILDVTPQEGLTIARYPWRQLAGSVSISRKERRQNSGPHQLINLVKAKTEQLENSMQWVFNDVLHGLHGSGHDAGGGQTYGENIINDSNGAVAQPDSNVGFESIDNFVRFDAGNDAQHRVGGVVADLDEPQNAWWCNYSIPGRLRMRRGGQPGAATPAGTEDTWAGAIDNSGGTTGGAQNLGAVMRALYNRMSDGSDHPDVGLTSQEVYDLYESSMVPFERFTDRKLGDVGFLNLQFKGMVLMYDHGIVTPLSAAGLGVPLYMLNTKYLSLVVDKESDFYMTPFFRPENQAAETMQVLFMGNLTCRNRSKQGVIQCSIA